MPASRNNNSLLSVAKAGCAGVCSIYLVFFGIFLGFVGTILTATSYDSDFQTDFFADSNRGKRIAGFILIALSVIVMVIGITLCCYVCRAVNKATKSNSQHGTVISSQPLMSGQAPPGPISGYHTSQPTYPQAAGQMPYSPQAPGQPYAPPPQPGQANAYQQPYVPTPQQQPYPQPMPPSAPPAPYVPDGEVYPPMGYPSSGPSAPPPSYNDVTGELPPKAGAR